MQIELSTLLNSSQVLKKVIGTKLKAKTSWSLIKLIKQLEMEEQNFNEVKTNKIKEFGEYNSENDTYFISPENPNFKTVTQELTEVLQTKIEIPDIKIKLSEIENLEFTIEELLAIEWLIEE